MTPRFLPLTFPCGCTTEQRPGWVEFRPCWSHFALHKDGIEIEAENEAILGCDCPHCEFGRFAKRRYDDGRLVRRAVIGENWKFFARLAARRRKATS